MDMATATERMAPRLHAAGGYNSEMGLMREHLERLTNEIRTHVQTIKDLTGVCELQRDEIDQLKKLG